MPSDGAGQEAESARVLTVGETVHDLNNILTSVLGYAEIIAEDARAGRVDVRDADQLLAATRAAVALIRGLRG